MTTLFKLLIVFAVGVLLYALSLRGMRSLQSRQLLSPQAIGILGGVIKWTILITVTLLGLNIIGISVSSLWASLSAVLVLVAVGFVAVWSVLSNATCALFLVIFAPFRIGDEVELLEPSAYEPDKPGIRGRVTEISFIYTTLVETLADGSETVLNIPNSQFFLRAIRLRQGKDTSSLKQALFGKDNGDRDAGPAGDG